MNTDVLHDKTTKYDKLAKPKKRVDRNVNQNPFHVGSVNEKGSSEEHLSSQSRFLCNSLIVGDNKSYLVKPGALSYQITDSLNKLANPKRRPEVNEPAESSSLNKTAPAATVKYGTHRLINSDEQSKDAQETKKKKFLIDTYARIVAARNKRTSKRLQELAKPKNYSARSEPSEEFDDYLQNMNKCNMKPAPRFAK